MLSVRSFASYSRRSCCTLSSSFNQNARQLSSASSQAKQKLKEKEILEIRPEVSRLLDNGLKYRFHPGIRNNPCPTLPLKLHMSVLSIINRYRSKQFRQDVERIRREFFEVFVENGQESDNPAFLNNRKISVDKKFDSTREDSDLNVRQLRKNFSSGEPFTPYECAAYMAARLTANYSAIKYVFNEICREEPEFQPTSLFDFGSGVGTTIWAADEAWKGSLGEVFSVDLNENMNELSRELLQQGTTHQENILDKTFYRQFLPVKHRPGYDIVVSSFSLLDFPDTRSRIYLVENLWKKTNGMLVLVEHGSKAGFTAIMEARNFLLQISKRQLDPLKSKRNSTNSEEIDTNVIHTEGSIVAPCPHEQVCPRQLANQRKSFCNFTANYKVLDIGQGNVGTKSEKFAYLVIKKNDFQQWSELQKPWPRVVQPTVCKSKHSICRVCTSSGKIQEFILSKSKTEEQIYRTVRRTSWGDKIPANVVKESVAQRSAGEEDEEK